VRTGAVLGAPATVPLASYPVRVAGDHIEVQVFP
jgi:nitrite reductase/ring-hydroxylating ferredoxin subunit